MALQKQIVPVVMGTGIDSSADPKITSQGLLLLENGVVNSRGEITKRTGLASIGNSNTSPYLTKFRDKPMIFDEGAGWIYQGSDETDGSDFSSVDADSGPALWEHAETKLDSTTQTRHDGGDYVELGNVSIYVDLRAPSDGSSVGKWHIVTINKNNNTVIDSEEHDYMVRLLKVGSTVYIFYVNGGDKKIYQKQMTTGDAGTIPASGTVIPSCPALDLTALTILYYQLHVALINSDGSAIALMGKKDSADEYAVIAWKPSPNTSAVVTISVTAGGTDPCFGLWQHADGSAWFVYLDTAASPMEVNIGDIEDDGTNNFDTSLHTFTSAAERPMAVIGHPLSSTQSAILWTYAYGATLKNTYDSVGGAGTAAIFLPGAWICSIPFYCSALGDYAFLVTQYTPTMSDEGHVSYFVVTHTGRILARILGGFADIPYNIYAPRSVFTIATDNWAFCVPKVLVEDRENFFDSETSLSRIEIQAISGGVPKTAEGRNHLAFPGSAPKVFDGRTIVEQGFFYFPVIESATVTAPGGATSIGVGVYNYIAVYRWLDANGIRHQSAISLSASATTTTANDKVTLVITTLGLTEKENVYVDLYRTKVDGSNYYYLTSIENDKTARSVSYDDTTGDSSLADEEKIYTTGNILEDRAPPPYKVSCIHQNRLFVADMESGDVFYSKDMGPANGLAFSPYFTIRCDSVDRYITALFSMADRLLIFYENQIWATHGQALDDTAGGQGYAVPYLISEAIGCINQNTIARVPQGLIFETNDGLYLLDKTFNLAPVGDRVKQQYDAVSLIKAVEIPEKHRVMWLSDGNALVLDHKHQIWSTFTHHECTDAVEAMGLLWIKRVGSNAVFVEDRSAYRDDAITGVSGDIILKIRTGWFSFNQPMGVMRVYRALLFGQNRSIHTLRVKTAYDMDPVWVDNQTFDSGDLGGYGEISDHFGAGLASGYTDKAYLVDVATSRQKVTSIMLEIADETTSGESDVEEGYSLTGISFEIGLKTGLKRQGAARRF